MDDAAFNTESVAADQLKAFIERIERLEEEKAGIAGDIKDVYAEAKGNGFDTKVLRKIISLRKRDYAERQEEDGDPRTLHAGPRDGRVTGPNRPATGG